MSKASHSAAIPGETAAEVGRVQMRHVEVDLGVAALAHAPHDRAGDDVAGRQLGQRMDLGHEAAALAVHQPPALAPHRLGDQRAASARDIERRRVELDELQVGQHRPGAQGHRHPVAGRLRRVGRLAEQLASTARRQHHCMRPDHLAAVLGMGQQRAAATFLRGQHVDREGLLQQLHAGLRAYRRQQCARYLAPGAIALGVQHPRPQVSPLARERPAPRRRAVEAGAELRQPVDRRHSLPPPPHGPPPPRTARRPPPGCRARAARPNHRDRPRRRCRPAPRRCSPRAARPCSPAARGSAPRRRTPRRAPRCRCRSPARR
ncbi:MAG: hypothetical protein KatS3mg102_1787 [Planctomycetota bacterium]|nr:MAG: hypothetical protein KatS3mg102_1787 [Planctomycetota bacterium]